LAIHRAGFGVGDDRWLREMERSSVPGCVPCQGDDLIGRFSGLGVSGLTRATGWVAYVVIARSVSRE